MIVNFIGEFLFHPAPLEMSGNTCTHGCAYCFANIRKESRYAKINSAFNQLKRREIKTFVDHLIQNGYPICLSNSTDPFSATDYVVICSQFLIFDKPETTRFVLCQYQSGFQEIEPGKKSGSERVAGQLVPPLFRRVPIVVESQSNLVFWYCRRLPCVRTACQ